MDDYLCREFDGSVLRTHQLVIGAVERQLDGGRVVEVEVARCETVGNPEGGPGEPACIQVAGLALTAVEARLFAAALLDAADRLEIITGFDFDLEGRRA
ncbi:MAG: hypothetical protein ACR2KJ_11260 [Jatrophihabitans sp.]